MRSRTRPAPRIARTVTVAKKLPDPRRSVEEQWRPVPGFDNYEASTLGRVRRRIGGSNSKAGKIMKLRAGTNSYLRICLHQDGKRWDTHVHRVVAITFLGPPPTAAHQVAHRDGSRENNTPENLRWSLPVENTRDKHRHGTMAYGDKISTCKLTEEQVREIRAATGNQRDIAKKFGISQANVWAIRTGAIWRHVA